MSTYSVSKKRKLKKVDDGGKSVSETKYDVFVSFRGEDIRDGFLSHLIKAFHRKNLKAFVDDQLERGDEIWPSLVEKIEGSFISLIIFSADYASSRWCLEEVVKILDCRDKYQQIVIPVFYHVDPTCVQHQTGTYENSFAEHGKKYDSTKVQIWRDALNISANLAGIKSSDVRNDADLVEEVVNLLLKRLCKYPVNSEGLVHSKRLIGIDRQMADVERLLHHPRVIGIWGMGGIGKTTIAIEVYNKLRSKYNGCCFLQNVREESSRHGIISLKEKLFSKLIGEDVKIDTPNGLSSDIERRINGMKVLIVLDDVNDSDHLENLLGEACDMLGSESRIIITTRNKQVLSTAFKAYDIHEVGVLSPSEALELFNLNAFNRSHLKKEYRKLSKRVVRYASGIPLVLKVLGRLLHGKDNEVWESQLNKLEKMPDQQVYDVMRLSYDDLDRKEKKIFLDLACFFIGSGLKVGEIKSLLRDGKSDNSVTVVFERLKDKALVTFSEDNCVSMHDIIREMAWEIVRQESSEDPGSRSRLWDPDDCREVLENDKGTEAIRSIRMYVFNSSLKLSPHAFANMSKLQFLEFNGSCDKGFNLCHLN